MEIVGSFWALVPPIVAIVLALITKETYSSLFVGILVGAVLLAMSEGGNFITNLLDYLTLGSVGGSEDPNVGFITAISDPWNAGIFVFLVLLGIMVALVNASGSSAAFGKWAATHVKSRVGALLATFFLGILLFIDDYFNCLTVGAVMRPVTDEQKISRAKLSYMIDATAAPICMIAPISSWAAAVSATASDLDTGITGIQLFIQAIPYNFYSLLTIVFVIIISVMGFDYGPMAKAEMAAYKEGVLGSLGHEDVSSKSNASLIDMVLPVVVLIASCAIGMMYVGGFWDAEADGFMNLPVAFGDTDASVGLPWGSIIAVIFAFIYFIARRVISFKEATACFVEGFKAMVPALLILTFALTLKLTTSALGAADYVASLLDGAGALYSFLPAIIFLVALFLAFSTGTSWGTFGILIPIVVAVFPADSTLLVIGISACLAGAVCGDHISPISDTTIMASAGANVDHIQHVNTQIPYALTVASVSFVCFLVAGFVQNWVICLALGLVLTVAAAVVLSRTIGQKVAA